MAVIPDPRPDPPSSMVSSSPGRLLLVVPAYNEEGNIKETLRQCAGLPWKAEVLVIDDGSKDQTARYARQAGAKVISLPFNLGIGAAVQTGFLYAREQDFDCVVQIDGDNQHDVNFVPSLLQPIFNGEAEMTIGSRFLPPYLGYRSTWIRRIGIHFFARLISAITGFAITDPTSGFRGYNKKMIHIFAEEYPHDYPEPEAIVVARRYKLRVKEVPVTMRKRSHGHSSIRYFYTLYYMIKVTLAVMLARIKTRRREVA